MITGAIVAVLLAGILGVIAADAARALLREWRHARRVLHEDQAIGLTRPPGTHGPLIKTVRVYLDGHTVIESRSGVRTVPGRCPECQAAGVDDELRRLTDGQH